MITRQPLASIGKKSRHQKDTTTSTLNKDNNKSTATTKDCSNMAPKSNEDCLNTVSNSNVIHTNDSVITNKSLSRSFGKNARYQKDTTTPTLNKDNYKSTTTIKDRLSTIPNSDVIHTNDSVTINTLLRSIGKRARHQKDSTSTLNDDNNNSTITTKDCSSTTPNGNKDGLNDSITTNKLFRSIGKRVRHQKDNTSTLNDDNDKITTTTTTTTKDCSNTVPNSNKDHLNDSVTTNNATNKSIDPINTSNLLECIDSVSFDNYFVGFIDEGTVVDSSIMMGMNPIEKVKSVLHIHKNRKKLQSNKLNIVYYHLCRHFLMMSNHHRSLYKLNHKIHHEQGLQNQYLLSIIMTNYQLNHYNQ